MNHHSRRWLISIITPHLGGRCDQTGRYWNFVSMSWLNCCKMLLHFHVMMEGDGMCFQSGWVCCVHTHTHTHIQVASFTYFWAVSSSATHTKNTRVLGVVPDGVIGFFHWHNPPGRTMTLGSTQPLTEMSTRNVSWGWRWPVRRADNLTTFMCRLSWNLGASASCPVLSRPVMGLLLLSVVGDANIYSCEVFFVLILRQLLFFI